MAGLVWHRHLFAAKKRLKPRQGSNAVNRVDRFDQGADRSSAFDFVCEAKRLLSRDMALAVTRFDIGVRPITQPCVGLHGPGAFEQLQIGLAGPAA